MSSSRVLRITPEPIKSRESGFGIEFQNSHALRAAAHHTDGGAFAVPRRNTFTRIIATIVEVEWNRFVCFPLQYAVWFEQGDLE